MNITLAKREGSEHKHTHMHTHTHTHTHTHIYINDITLCLNRGNIHLKKNWFFKTYLSMGARSILLGICETLLATLWRYVRQSIAYSFAITLRYEIGNYQEERTSA